MVVKTKERKYTRGVQEKVMEALTRFDGKQFTISQIEKVTGLDRTQIRGALYWLTKNNKEVGAHVKQLARGVYQYSTNGLPSVVETNDYGTTFRLIARASEGRVVLQDQAGDLYVAKKV